MASSTAPSRADEGHRGILLNSSSSSGTFLIILEGKVRQQNQWALPAGTAHIAWGTETINRTSLRFATGSLASAPRGTQHVPGLKQHTLDTIVYSQGARETPSGTEEPGKNRQRVQYVPHTKPNNPKRSPVPGNSHGLAPAARLAPTATAHNALVAPSLPYDAQQGLDSWSCWLTEE